MLPIYLSTVRAKVRDESGGTTTKEVWGKEWVNLYALQGLKDWYGICTPTVPNCQSCTLQVRFERRPEAWQGYERDFPAATEHSFSSDCSSRVCDKTWIMINSTDAFTGMNSTTERRIPVKWFNQDDEPTVANQPGDGLIRYFSFVSVMRHEVGHVLGFGHAYNTNERRYCSPWTINDHENQGIRSVMNNSIGANEEPGNVNIYTEYDVCVYKLAYCCGTGTTSVDEKVGYNPGDIRMTCSRNAEGSFLITMHDGTVIESVRTYDLLSRLCNSYHNGTRTNSMIVIPPQQQGDCRFVVIQLQTGELVRFLLAAN
jgi:hypothetical protein